MQEALSKGQQGLGLLATRLDAVSPLAVLKRGYSVTMSGKAKLKSVDDVHWGDELITTLQDGKIVSVVEQVEKRSENND
jgi:exodeoxyribonuclease VII large subunit